MVIMDIGALILFLIPNQLLFYDYVYFLMGAIVFVLGWASQKRFAEGWIKRRSKSIFLRAELAKWDMFFSYDDAGQSLITEITLLITRFQSIAFMLTGAGVMVLTAAFAVFDYVFFAGTFSFDYFITILILFVIFPMKGLGIGYLIASRQLRREKTDTQIETEPSNQSLTDFRARFFAFAAVGIWCISVINAIFGIVAYQNHAYQLVDNPFMTPQFDMFFSIGSAVVCGASVLFNETLMRKVARSPHLIFFSYLPLALKLDHSLRTRAIGSLQSISIVISATIIESQSGIFMSALSRQTSSTWEIFSGEFLFSALLVAAGYLLIVFQGRLGGSLTGWPWKQKQLQVEEAIQQK